MCAFRGKSKFKLDADGNFACDLNYLFPKKVRTVEGVQWEISATVLTLTAVSLRFLVALSLTQHVGTKCRQMLRIEALTFEDGTCRKGLYPDGWQGRRCMRHSWRTTPEPPPPPSPIPPLLYHVDSATPVCSCIIQSELD